MATPTTEWILFLNNGTNNFIGLSITASGLAIAQPGQPSVPESWHYVGTAGKPSFASDWANFGSSDADLAFQMTPDGSVWINGVVTPSAGAGSLLFTLPADYLPASKRADGVIHTNGQVTTGNSVASGDAYVINGRYSLTI